MYMDLTFIEMNSQYYIYILQKFKYGCKCNEIIKKKFFYFLNSEYLYSEFIP